MQEKTPQNYKRS